jgi:hypothetical protein
MKNFEDEEEDENEVLNERSWRFRWEPGWLA